MGGVAGLLVLIGGYLVSQRTDISQDREITIVHPRTNEAVLTLTLPGGWVSDPYFPEGAGFPVMLFAGRDEHAKAKRSIQRGATSFYPEVRGITGVLLKQNAADPATIVDGWIKGVPAQEKRSWSGESLPNGQRWCGEARQDDQYYVMCYVVFSNGKAANFSLTSGGEAYSSDLATLQRVIGSVR